MFPKLQNAHPTISKIVKVLRPPLWQLRNWIFPTESFIHFIDEGRDAWPGARWWVIASASMYVCMSKMIGYLFYWIFAINIILLRVRGQVRSSSVKVASKKVSIWLHMSCWNEETFTESPPTNISAILSDKKPGTIATIGQITSVQRTFLNVFRPAHKPCMCFSRVMYSATQKVPSSSQLEICLKLYHLSQRNFFSIPKINSPIMQYQPPQSLVWARSEPLASLIFETIYN